MSLPPQKNPAFHYEDGCHPRIGMMFIDDIYQDQYKSGITAAAQLYTPPFFISYHTAIKYL
jgi:hypothetical protein